MPFMLRLTRFTWPIQKVNITVFSSHSNFRLGHSFFFLYFWSNFRWRHYFIFVQIVCHEWMLAVLFSLWAVHTVVVVVEHYYLCYTQADAQQQYAWLNLIESKQLFCMLSLGMVRWSVVKKRHFVTEKRPRTQYQRAPFMLKPNYP